MMMSYHFYTATTRTGFQASHVVDYWIRGHIKTESLFMCIGDFQESNSPVFVRLYRDKEYWNFLPTTWNQPIDNWKILTDVVDTFRYMTNKSNHLIMLITCFEMFETSKDEIIKVMDKNGKFCRLDVSKTNIRGSTSKNLAEIYNGLWPITCLVNYNPEESYLELLKWKV